MEEKCFECGMTGGHHFDGCYAGRGARAVVVAGRRRSVIREEPPSAVPSWVAPRDGVKAFLILRVGQIGAAAALEFTDGRVEFVHAVPAGL